MSSFPCFGMLIYILCHCIMEIYNLLFDFTGDYIYESVFTLKREFELLSHVETEGLWKTFEVGLNAFLCYCNYMPVVTSG